MSFRLFIYYCALCGAWAAFLGWLLGRFVEPESPLLRSIGRGVLLAILITLALAFVDGIWNLTLARTGQLLARVGSAVLAGLVGSLIGTSIGQGLYSVTQGSFIGYAFVIVGWTLTGLLIGASIGLWDVVPRLLAGQSLQGGLKKSFNGVLGGTLGGLVGGVLYILLTLPFESAGRSLLTPSAIGSVLLGLCIGLFIGLAQVILKEAWVRVEAGFRPGRELILSKPETVIGRAESCDIGLFGDNTIERTHSRIILQQNRYLLADNGTAAGTLLNGARITGPTPLRAGDEIQVGRSVLRFEERQKKK
jgi:hypothetical protein